MKKGIVMEVRRQDSIVLSDGSFTKIRNKKEMEVGQEILFTDEDLVTYHSSGNGFRGIYRYASVAAVFVFVTLMSLMYYNNNLAAYTAVTMDINPSIELELNKNDVVIDVIALNDDGTSFETLDLKGRSFEEAVELLFDEAVAQGYIVEGEETHVVFSTVSLRGDDEEKSGRLTAVIEAVVTQDEDPILESVTVTVIEATKEQLEEAEETGLPTPLVVFEDDLDLSGVTSVKELFEQVGIDEALGNRGKVVKEYKEQVKSEEKAEEQNGPNLGASEETRGDLLAIVEKIQYVVDTYGSDEAYADQVALAQAFIDTFNEGEYDFREMKETGNALLKELRKAGIKIDIGEGDSEPEAAGSESEDKGPELEDEDEDKDDADIEDEDESAEKFADLQETISDLKEMADEIPGALEMERNGESLETYLGRAEAAVVGDGEKVLKELHEAGRAWIKYLREEGHKAGGADGAPGKKTEQQNENASENDNKNSGKDNEDSDKSNNGNSDKSKNK